MKRIFTTINEYASSQEYDNLIQIRMDKIFDTIEEYRNEYNIQVEVKDVNFKDYTDFSKKHLLEINHFVSKINKDGKIWNCDFPTFWISRMDDLGSGPEIDELEIDQIPISIEYKYTHVYNQYEKFRRGFDYELVDRYEVKYENSTDEWDSNEILMLKNEGVFHSEHGIIGLSPKDIKNYVEKI